MPPQIRSLELKDPIHFIGIGGSGMSALAECLVQKKIKVTGSDVSQTSATQDLAALGVPIFYGHKAEQVGNARSVVYSTAIADDNPELKYARDLGRQVLHRSEVLNALLEQQTAITVAGTHGKTTTTAMVGHILQQLGLDPTVLIGGKALNFGAHGKFGGGKCIVAEADESDGSLAKYHPFIGVLTNIDNDHLNYFGTLEKKEEFFRTYLTHIHKDGCAVVGWNSDPVRRISDGLHCKRLAVGTRIGSDVRLLKYASQGFSMKVDAVVERDLISFALPAIGQFNIVNALCALGVARGLELDIQKSAAALATFRGVERRLAIVHESSGRLVLDDYAHNPGKVAAVIQCVKETFPQMKLHVFFQPHRYSRLKTMFAETLNSFRGADEVYVLPVYAAGEPEDLDLSPEKWIARLPAKGHYVEGFEEAIATAKGISAGIILTLGAGDISKVAYALGDHHGQESS